MGQRRYVNVNGVAYVRLYCHDITDIYKGIPSPKKIWKHKDCEGDVYVGDNACLYCDKCGQISHLRNVTWHSPLTSTSVDYYVSFYNATPYHPYTRWDVGSVIYEGVVNEGRMSWAWEKEFLNNL